MLLEELISSQPITHRVKTIRANTPRPYNPPSAFNRQTVIDFLNAYDDTVTKAENLCDVLEDMLAEQNIRVTIIPSAIFNTIQETIASIRELFSFKESITEDANPVEYETLLTTFNAVSDNIQKLASVTGKGALGNLNTPAPMQKRLGKIAPAVEQLERSIDAIVKKIPHWQVTDFSKKKNSPVLNR